MDVHTALLGIVDKLEHARNLVPVVLVLGLEVRDLQPCPRPSCKFNCFSDSLFHPIVLISHVDSVEGVMLCHNLQQGDELLGPSV